VPVEHLDFTLAGIFAADEDFDLTMSPESSGAGTFTIVDLGAVPEPGTVSLMFSGLLGLGMLVGVKRYTRNRLATEA
jgi:hypothetical protein